MYLEIFLADFVVFRVFLGISWDFTEIPEFRGSATAQNIRSPVLYSQQSCFYTVRPWNSPVTFNSKFLSRHPVTAMLQPCFHPVMDIPATARELAQLARLFLHCGIPLTALVQVSCITTLLQLVNWQLTRLFVFFTRCQCCDTPSHTIYTLDSSRLTSIHQDYSTIRT